MTESKMGDTQFATALKECCLGNLVNIPPPHDRRVARKYGPRSLSPGLPALTSRENFHWCLECEFPCQFLSAQLC